MDLPVPQKGQPLTRPIYMHSSLVFWMQEEKKRCKSTGFRKFKNRHMRAHVYYCFDPCTLWLRASKQTLDFLKIRYTCLFLYSESQFIKMYIFLCALHCWHNKKSSWKSNTKFLQFFATMYMNSSDSWSKNI